MRLRSLWPTREYTVYAQSDIEPTAQDIARLVPRRAFDGDVHAMIDDFPERLVIGDARVDDLVKAIAVGSIAPVPAPFAPDAMPDDTCIARTIVIEMPSTLPERASRIVIRCDASRHRGTDSTCHGICSS